MLCVIYRSPKRIKLIFMSKKKTISLVLPEELMKSFGVPAIRHDAFAR